jgi:hypothetical protein
MAEEIVDAVWADEVRGRVLRIRASTLDESRCFIGWK